MEGLFSFLLGKLVKKKFLIPFQISCIDRWFTIYFPGEKMPKQNKQKLIKIITKASHESRVLIIHYTGK